MPTPTRPEPPMRREAVPYVIRHADSPLYLAIGGETHYPGLARKFRGKGDAVCFLVDAGLDETRYAIVPCPEEAAR